MFSAILLMLSGCTNKEFHIGWYDKCLPSTAVQVKKVYPNIDNELLTCGGIPRPPEMTMQSEVALHLVNLTDAGNKCRDNLLFVNKVLVDFKAKEINDDR